MWLFHYGKIFFKQWGFVCVCVCVFLNQSHMCIFDSELLFLKAAGEAAH